MYVFEQFKILEIIPINVFGYVISFTNSTLFMAITALSLGLLSFIGLKKVRFVPGFFQSINEIIFNFVKGICKEHLGKEYKNYQPLIMSLFLFIVFGNLLGLFPMSFTITSHLSVTMALSLIVFCMVVFVGIRKHGFKFFKLFIPNGVPLVMSPLIFLIEFAIFLVKPLILSLRLCVNMVAGHIMLKVFLGFAVKMKLFSFIPVFACSILLIFEFFVAIFQAYIFTVLACISLKDALYLH
ncbi:F0F1 ATP synthase subunit A [Candidatus Nesciobacter abundans]|uniref:ATP synthase subunit a n=1 Tax=Candidatus Nesciobacter abundans TaxID=2601668 RepID=A0A5C0UGP2_9PROT|nr:F0F1 ATP synthase subunit A [Candidatus Nesciobacter abundans]QEK38877.1 F0F1 ATP synthase subunit A [Candidatus Nesciobacter abundans]